MFIVLCTLLLLTLVPTPARALSAAWSRPVCEAQSGVVRRMIVAGDLQRSYLVSVPAGLRTRAPILVAFHGYSSSAATLARSSRLHDAAGAAGFVTVYPDGTGSPSRWAIPQQIPGPDDAAFVDAVLADVARTSCGDTSAVFAAGFSNGAAFVGHLTCLRPRAFRGVAFVGGAGLAGACAARRSPPTLPVVIVHGGADRVVGAGGGPVLGGALRAEPLTTTVERWRRARHEVTFRLLPRWGHTWPALATEEIVTTFAG